MNSLESDKCCHLMNIGSNLQITLAATADVMLLHEVLIQHNSIIIIIAKESLL